MDVLRRLSRSLVVVAICVGPVLPAGSEPLRLEVAPTASGEAYQSAVAGRRVVTDAAYYDPALEAPPLTVRRGAAPREERQRDGGLPVSARTVINVIAVVILVLVVGVAIRFRGAATASFAGPGERRRQGSVASTDKGLDVAAASGEMTLADVARMADPRQAIIALGRIVVRHAADDNGIGVGRSWTVRDVLRRLPADWPHLAALTAIARAAEITHYGGRDIDALEVQAHVDAARPILAGAKP